MKAITMNRHHLVLLTLTIILLAVAVERPVSAADVQRPNCIFFLTDDQRNDTLVADRFYTGVLFVRRQVVTRR